MQQLGVAGCREQEGDVPEMGRDDLVGRRQRRRAEGGEFPRRRGVDVADTQADMVEAPGRPIQGCGSPVAAPR